MGFSELPKPPLRGGWGTWPGLSFAVLGSSRYLIYSFAAFSFLCERPTLWRSRFCLLYTCSPLCARQMVVAHMCQCMSRSEALCAMLGLGRNCDCFIFCLTRLPVARLPSTREAAAADPTKRGAIKTQKSPGHQSVLFVHGIGRDGAW